MKSTKHKGLWPLPGGTKSYVTTLYKVLDQIEHGNFTFQALVSWFKTEYNLKGEKTPASMLLYIKRFGFFSEIANIMVLSEDSKEFLKTKNHYLVYKVLTKAVLGIDDIIILLENNKDVSQNDVNKWFVEKYKVNWGTNAQVSFRINWLRSLGYVERSGKFYHLTDEGNRIEKKLTYNENDYLLKESIPITPVIVQKVPEQTTIEPILKSDLTSQLIFSQKDTSNPENYERLVNSAFTQLGFETKHIGGSGEPDVEFYAPLGYNSYTGIIDCKTGTSAIGEFRIDWLTLTEHKKRHNADYVLVIGPSFAGGRLVTRALETGVTLITTDFLLNLLNRHREMPFSLIELQPIFEKKGMLGVEELQYLDKIFTENKRHVEVMSTIFESLLELTLKKEKLDVSGLHIYLNYTKNVKCSRVEIEQVLDFLESKPISAISRLDGYLIPTVTLNTLKKKFEVLVNKLEKKYNSMYAQRARP